MGGPHRTLPMPDLWRIRGEQGRASAREQASKSRRVRLKRTLSSEARERMVQVVAPIMRRGEPTLFAFEGVIRAAIRSRLCMKGWGWADADFAAASVLGAALNRIGAVRPIWQQGQPDWVNDAGAKIDRTHCANCHRPLPDGHWKFCSGLCKSSFHTRMARITSVGAAEAVEAFYCEAG